MRVGWLVGLVLDWLLACLALCLTSLLSGRTAHSTVGILAAGLGVIAVYSATCVAPLVRISQSHVYGLAKGFPTDPQLHDREWNGMAPELDGRLTTGLARLLELAEDLLDDLLEAALR